MSKFTLLNKKQSIDFYNTYHSNGITDFAILTGGFVNDDNMASHDGEYYNGWTFTKTLGLNDTVHVITDAGMDNTLPIGTRLPSIRPALFTSEYSHRAPIFEMGYYPQKIVDVSLNEELEGRYKKNILPITGKCYTYAVMGSLNDILEFSFGGKEYVRIPVKNTDLFPYEFMKKISGDAVWVEVLPVKWVNYKPKRIIVSRYGLISGISAYDNFSFKHKKHTGANIRNFEHFIEEILFDDITQFPSSRLIDLNNAVLNNPLAQITMNKNNITIEDVELDKEDKLVRRRKWLD